MLISTLRPDIDGNYSPQLLLASSCLLSFILISPAKAQIVPDNSLGAESSIVTPQDTLTDLIEGGAIRDNNLFHSFSEFNVNNGARVDFANPDGITNILTRVTGNNISEILGSLGVNGGANLFLLNPNGIIFGENASLDLNGSFLATTADSYIFDNGFAYSSSHLEIPPLLTVNIPVGLQMGQNSASITINGNGHSIFRENDFEPVINFDNISGLRVQPNQNLSLISNGINFNSGIVATSAGYIELASISEGKVQIDSSALDWHFNYEDATKFSDINLFQKSLVDTTGINSGSIQVQGSNINLYNGSVIVNSSQIGEQKGIVNIEAKESLLIDGIAQNGIARSEITNQNFGLGNIGAVSIRAQNVIISDGGVVSNKSYGEGQGGEITIQVAESLLIYSSFNINSLLPGGISTLNFNQGNSGDIRVNATKIQLDNGSVIGSASFGRGNTGNVVVNASEFIQVEGFNPNGLIASSLGSLAFANGNAGNLNIKTKNLIVGSGGRVNTTTFNLGNAGNIDINASESILVTGTVPGLINSSLIDSSANVLNPIAQEILNIPSFPTGNAGSLNINTPYLKVTDGAEVTVRNDGTGDAGIVSINTDDILVDQGAGITASTELGDGGNIMLQVDKTLLLENNGFISAKAQQAGNGGNIFIDADAIAILDQSAITANAIAGDGGNIDVTTQGLFISSDSLVSASSEFGLDGEINIDNFNGDRFLESSPLPDNFIDANKEIVASCNVGNNKFAIAGQGGLPENPRQYLRGQTIWQDLRLLSNNPTQLTNNSSTIEYSPKPTILEAQT